MQKVTNQDTIKCSTVLVFSVRNSGGLIKLYFYYYTPYYIPNTILYYLFRFFSYRFDSWQSRLRCCKTRHRRRWGTEKLSSSKCVWFVFAGAALQYRIYLLLLTTILWVHAQCVSYYIPLEGVLYLCALWCWSCRWQTV